MLFLWIFRFEAKRQNDQSRPYSANRVPKSTSVASSRSRFEKAAHDSNVGKTEGSHPSALKVRSSHHGTVHDESGQHEPNHEVNHHGPSHHGPSHHGPSHHGSSHHGQSHPRTFRRELRSHHKSTSDEKPADRNNEEDAPLSAASIRSKFEAASKGQAPVKRKVG